jgi:UPF0716 protein FxsA
MLLAALLFVSWLVAEVYVAIRIAEAIGVLAMLLLLIASWPVGTWALRSQGRAALRRLRDAVAVNRPPGREVLDGALVLAGGALMLVPGFITDVLGVLLLVPATRWLARGLLVRNLRSRLVVRATRFARRSYDVDSTATDIPPPRLEP